MANQKLYKKHWYIKTRIDEILTEAMQYAMTHTDEYRKISNFYYNSLFNEADKLAVELLKSYQTFPC